MQVCYDPDHLIDVLKLSGRKGARPQLKGVDLQCCCPFPHGQHADGSPRYERNPSFGIHVIDGKWNCYSCGRKGLTLNQLFHALDIYPYPRIRKINLNVYDVNKDGPKTTHLSNRYFKAITRNVDKAIEYFLKRGLDIPETIHKYRIGVSDDARHIYLPITNVDGELEGWGERQFNKNYGKWLNRPDGFKKDNSIYGIYEANGCKDIVVVESFVDVLKFDSIGYPAVSTLGAKVTDRQVEILLEHFDSFTFIPHNDDAGKMWFQSLWERMSGRCVMFVSRLPGEYNDAAEVMDDEILHMVIKKKVFVRRVYERDR